MSKLKTTSYILICVAVYALFLLYCIEACPLFLENLRRANAALGESVGYYFEFIFNTDIPTWTPVIATVPEGIDAQLPLTWNEFTVLLSKWWSVLWAKENFMSYLVAIGDFLEPLLKVLAIVAPLVACIVIILKQFEIPSENVKRTQSLPLRMFVKFEVYVSKPVIQYVKELFAFALNSKIIKPLYVLTFLVFFNISAILIELIAFVFYFVVSFNFSSIYSVVVRTFCNLAPVFALPFWVWIIAVTLIILNYRVKRAKLFLNALEGFNVDFIKELPLISMSVGTMGSKKTTCITDMTLTASTIFRYQAKKTMLEKSLLFPNFNWRLFEDELLACFQDGNIWSLSSAKDFVSALKTEYDKTSNVDYLFDYDVAHFPLTVYDGLRNVEVWKAMEVYAQCFFIYTRKSLTISNYSIKENSRIEYVGNSPLVTYDFHSDVREGEYSHVINFDSLRLGRKYEDSDEDRKARPFYDFGIIVVTEAGKERGNQLDTRGQKKDAEEVNQLNDLFNDFIKLIRHRCTVDYFPYAMVFFDDQRPESLGADCRELAYINQIAESSELKLAMPFFWVEELLHSWLYPKYKEYNEEYNFYSGKKTLRYYLYTKFISTLHNFYVRMYNRYGYYCLTINQQSGKMDGAPIEKHYYLCKKKVYSDTFATDCYGAYLADSTSRSGIDNLPYYADVVPSCEEYDYQKSHLVENKLKNYSDKGGEVDG